MFPPGTIFSDFGPNYDFFWQKGPKIVRFFTRKSDFDQNEEKQRLKSVVLSMNLKMHFLKLTVKV